AKYGRLYLWSAAMDSAEVFSNGGKGCGYGVECNARVPVRGVCPAGWHLPSKAEWWTLFETIGDTSIAGKKLKSTSGWYDDGNGMDTYGFSLLPAGHRNGAGNYGNANFWSATVDVSGSTYRMYLGYSYDYASLRYGGKNYARSVRCLKD
uniref:FISUMP domain-containing protein n=1 Tax=uncultured Fibrobacter sp. TaxID=261512 RepID=UPI0028052C2A